MAPESSGTGVVEFRVELCEHHLENREHNLLLHHIRKFGYVVHCTIQRDMLFIAADFGKLDGKAFVHASEILRFKILRQIVRIKAKELYLVRA